MSQIWGNRYLRTALDWSAPPWPTVSLTSERMSFTRARIWPASPSPGASPTSGRRRLSTAARWPRSYSRATLRRRGKRLLWCHERHQLLFAGTTGWSNTFAGRPAVLWNPLIQVNGSSFGVRSNQFGFNVTGTGHIPIVVETCTNLVNPEWVPLTTTGSSMGHFISANRFRRIPPPASTASGCLELTLCEKHCFCVHFVFNRAEVNLLAKLKMRFAGKAEPEHLRRGKLGEQAAKKHLQQHGLKFLTANFRSKRGRLIWFFGTTIVWCLWKSRHGRQRLDASGGLGRCRKRRLLSKCALDYLRLLKNPPIKIRFDVVEVLLHDGWWGKCGICPTRSAWPRLIGMGERVGCFSHLAKDTPCHARPGRE